MKSVHRSYDELLGFQKGNLMDIQHFILLDFEKFSCTCISYIYYINHVNTYSYIILKLLLVIVLNWEYIFIIGLLLKNFRFKNGARFLLLHCKTVLPI